jgi:hypothetical protein
MRTLVTIALAALAGVHCAAPTYSEAGDGAAAEQVATEEPALVSPGTTSDDSHTDKDDPRWGINAEGLPPMLFTSSVHGEDGAVYATGTFAGWLTVGGDTLKSKGDDDVVLVRLDANGRVTWAKSIGSIHEERSPKVTFVDGKVRILAETEGQVDCGSGDMGKWSSGMFFYCLYAPDGTALGGATFPTGAP